jgi:hypothetical protein
MNTMRQTAFNPADVQRADGGVLILWWGLAGSALDHCEVEETASQVTITLYEEYQPAAPPARYVPRTVFIPLVVPLAYRELVDGSTQEVAAAA